MQIGRNQCSISEKGIIRDINMKKAYLKYISALILFGLNGIVASFISLNSYEIVLLRTFIGSVFLILVFIFGKKKLQLLKKKKQLVFLIISGVAMGASWMFLYEAYSLIGVSVATLAYYCGPVMVIMLAPILFKEKITGVKIIGFIAVMLGMICVNAAAILSDGFSWGLVCGILSALMYCFMVIFNKKAKDITGLENTMCQLVMGCVVAAVFTLFTRSGAIHISKENIVPILILGIVNTGVGCYLYFSSIQKLSAQSVSICGYLEPLSALIFSAIFLREHLTIIQITGSFLILGGAAFSELYKRNFSA